jgi:hypothetical protein
VVWGSNRVVRLQFIKVFKQILQLFCMDLILARGMRHAEAESDERIFLLGGRVMWNILSEF